MPGFMIKTLEWTAGILASLIVVCLTQAINDHCVAPRQELRSLIRKASYTVDYYANIIVNPGVCDSDLEKEASNEIRKVALELMAFVATYPKLKYKHLTAQDLDSIGPELIRISNTVGVPSAIGTNFRELKEIREKLYGKK